MPSSWKLSAFAPKPVIEAALQANSDALDWDPEIVVSGFEVSVDRPDDWRLDAYLARQPTDTDQAAILNLFLDNSPDLHIEELPDEDWVTTSQKGVEPIRAGRFYVHTPDYPKLEEAGMRSLGIPASQAFGTGQHETTSGCLSMLSMMADRGIGSHNLADIGTGTGLLAFAAMHLWPSARASASDIDPVCLEVILRNMESNQIRSGEEAGELTVIIADGMDDPALQSRAPYDLLIANILSAPLIDMAGDFANAVSEDGSILLAGLLETQEDRVREAYTRVGFDLVERLVNGDWSILWLQRSG